MEKEFQDLFQIRHNDDRVEVGKVLIAEPFLEGKYFNRSVVYMVEHDSSGSVGFVLNKPLPYTTSEIGKRTRRRTFPRVHWNVPWSVISCITSIGEMTYRTRKRSRKVYIGEVILRL